MAEATDKQRRKATTNAAVAVICLSIFSALFMGVVTMMSNTVDEREADYDLSLSAELEPQEPFYVLLIGSDSRKGTAFYTGQEKDESQLSPYADIMTLMRVDPLAHVITLVSIPRDTIVEPDGDKVNAALRSNDPQDVVDEVARLTGVQADYYMMTTFIAFENLVNAIGGIEVDVPVTVTVPDPADGKKVTLKAGKKRHLDGSQTLVLARARKEYGSGDQEALRQVNVRNIEKALIDKMLEMDGGFDVEHVLAALEHDTYTDMDLDVAGVLMIDFVAHADEVTIFDGTGPYKGETRKSDDAWVVHGDEETWAQLMAIVDAGGDPNTFIAEPKF